jgi:hypothetical protein
MIIKRFFKENSNEIVIFKVNFKLKFEKFRVFVTFYKNLHTRLRSRSRAKKLWLRLQQKVADPPAPAPAPGSATLVLIMVLQSRSHTDPHVIKQFLTVPVQIFDCPPSPIMVFRFSAGTYDAAPKLQHLPHDKVM